MGEIAEKISVGVYFDNMALYFECRINKKRTASDCFLAIFPTGKQSSLGRIPLNPVNTGPNTGPFWSSEMLQIQRFTKN